MQQCGCFLDWESENYCLDGGVGMVVVVFEYLG